VNRFGNSGFIIAVLKFSFRRADLMAQVSMAAVAALKETYVQLKPAWTKRWKLPPRAGGDAHRPRLGQHAGHHSRRLLRIVDASEPDRASARSDAQMITVQPFDPGVMSAIEKAIRSAGLG